VGRFVHDLDEDGGGGGSGGGGSGGGGGVVVMVPNKKFLIFGYSNSTDSGIAVICK